MPEVSAHCILMSLMVSVKQKLMDPDSYRSSARSKSSQSKKSCEKPERLIPEVIAKWCYRLVAMHQRRCPSAPGALKFMSLVRMARTCQQTSSRRPHTGSMKLSMSVKFKVSDCNYEIFSLVENCKLIRIFAYSIQTCPVPYSRERMGRI